MQAAQAINADSLLQHIKDLSADSMEGRAPGTPGEQKATAYMQREFQALGLKPGNPDGTWIQKVRADRLHVASDGEDRIGRQDAGARVSRRLRGEFAPQPPRDQGRQLGRGVRGLRRRGARVRLGRLQGPRREGQDDSDARQRPAGDGCRRHGAARHDDVQGQGDDVLRPVDVQVRDRLDQGRRGRDHHPRDGARRLSVRRGEGELQRRAVRHPVARRRAACAGGRVDHGSTRRRRCSATPDSTSTRCTRRRRARTSSR